MATTMIVKQKESAIYVYAIKGLIKSTMCVIESNPSKVFIRVLVLF